MQTKFASLRKRLKKLFFLALAWGFYTSLPLLPVFADGNNGLRMVAFSENAAPGTSVSFSRFLKPVMNGSGQIAFSGFLAGSTVSKDNESGVWIERNGTLALVARAGSPATGTDENFQSFRTPILSRSGHVAFLGRLTEGGAGFSSDTGIWRESEGTLEVLTQSGDEAPGTSKSFSNYRGFTLNESGHAAFFAEIVGADVDRDHDSGIWSAGSGTLALVAREGNAAPGTSAKFLSFSTPLLTGAGQVVFRSGLRKEGEPIGNDGGVWSEVGGSLSLVAHTGDIAPGTTVGFSDFSLDRPAVNEAGQIAFRAGLSGDGVEAINDKGTWSQRGGALTLIGREGDAAAGTPADFDLLNRLVLNSEGKMAFLGRLVGEGVHGSNNHAIWSEGGGSLDLLARQGSLAPGTNGNFISFQSLVFNDAGQAGFLAKLRGSDLSFKKNSGIWAQDKSGNLRLIVQKGDLIDVEEGPGTDFRAIQTLLLAESGVTEDGKSGFNNRGQLAFRAVFTDGTSGIFVSNLVAVPEPSSLVLFILAVAMPTRRRDLRRR